MNNLNIQKHFYDYSGLSQSYKYSLKLKQQ